MVVSRMGLICAKPSMCRSPKGKKHRRPYRHQLKRKTSTGAHFENVERLTLNAKNAVVANVDASAKRAEECEFHPTAGIESKLSPYGGNRISRRMNEAQTQRGVGFDGEQRRLNQKIRVVEYSFGVCVNEAWRNSKTVLLS